MKKIYIAGPFRGPDAWAINCNVHVAESLIPLIGKAGHIPMCVHSMYRNMQGALPDEFWLKATMEIMEMCDAVFMCEGWRNSVGSVCERDRAIELGMPVFETLGELFEWMAGQGGGSSG